MEELEGNTQVLAFAYALLMAYDNELEKQQAALDKWVRDLER